MAAKSAITVKHKGGPWKKGVSGNPSGRPKRTPEEHQLIEACRQKTPEALNVIQDLMDHSENDRVRLQAAQFIIERGYGRAPERIELKDAREQGPLPGSELSGMEAYMQLIKFKTYEEISSVVVDAEKTDSGDYQVIELDG